MTRRGCVWDALSDGGGLTPAARARREQVRLEAAGLFAAGVMQYRPGLLDAFVTHTGLIANPRSK